MALSTLGTYLQVSNNLTKWQNLTSSQPEVKAATAYYQANIGSVKTPAELVNNYRLFSYVMTAYGLGDMASYGKGLIEKTLEEGTGSQSNLAYTLNNPEILSLAQTFNFAADGASATTSTAATSGVVSNYIEQTMDSNEGQSNPGIQLALHFQQNASSIQNAYNILADKNLLTVVQTALGISSLTSEEDVDTQSNLITSTLKNEGYSIADFQDPTKVQKFVEKFCAMYDITNPSSTTSPDVPNCVLSSSSSGTSGGFSSSLLSSMQSIII